MLPSVSEPSLHSCPVGSLQGAHRSSRLLWSPETTIEPLGRGTWGTLESPFSGVPLRRWGMLGSPFPVLRLGLDLTQFPSTNQARR